jgi:hypothetical protein
MALQRQQKVVARRQPFRRGAPRQTEGGARLEIGTGFDEVLFNQVGLEPFQQRASHFLAVAASLLDAAEKRDVLAGDGAGPEPLDEPEPDVDARGFFTPSVRCSAGSFIGTAT